MEARSVSKTERRRFDSGPPSWPDNSGLTAATIRQGESSLESPHSVATASHRVANREGAGSSPAPRHLAVAQ